MARRIGGRGDPSIRAAIIADREWMAATFETMRHLVVEAAPGRPLDLTTGQLAHALFRAGHPRGWEFTHAHDRDGVRRWHLDEHDRLEEVTR